MKCLIVANPAHLAALTRYGFKTKFPDAKVSWTPLWNDMGKYERYVPKSVGLAFPDYPDQFY